MTLDVDFRDSKGEDLDNVKMFSTDGGEAEQTLATLSEVWCPLDWVHELIWKISLMEEVE